MDRSITPFTRRITIIIAGFRKSKGSRKSRLLLATECLLNADGGLPTLLVGLKDPAKWDQTHDYLRLGNCLARLTLPLLMVMKNIVRISNPQIIFNLTMRGRLILSVVRLVGASSWWANSVGASSCSLIDPSSFRYWRYEKVLCAASMRKYDALRDVEN